MSTGDKYQKQLLYMLCSISDPSDMEAALRLLLSQGELDRIARRLQIFRMLAREIPQREIAATLNLGIATVTRGAAVFQKDAILELEQKIKGFEEAVKNNRFKDLKRD